MEEKKLRTHCVSVRLNPLELIELDKRRGKIRRGTFLRNMFLGRKEPPQIPIVNLDSFRVSARWAANLNQIARSLNVGADVDIEAVRSTLRSFRLALLGGEDEK